MPKNSVLDEVAHRRLIEDMTAICTQAGVPSMYVHRSMRGVCSDTECKWVLNYHKLQDIGKCGLVLQGDDIENRALSIGGALIRNFIDARVYTLQRVIDEDPNPTVLIIPNFYVAAIDCKPHPSWKIDQIYGLLLDRMTKGLQTVIGVTNISNMESVYGTNVVKHLRDHYLF